MKTKLLLRDWKTGRVAVPPPQANMQLQFLGLCASMHYKAEPYLDICYIRPSGEHKIIGPWHMDKSVREKLKNDLELNYQERLQAREDIKKKKMVRVIEGKHCKYCPAKASCPAREE